MIMPIENTTPPLYPITNEKLSVVKEPAVIPGGYILTARKVDESEIAHAAPCIRETWSWLLRQCNHKPNGNIKRGQCMRTLSDIQDGLHWHVGYRKMTYSKSQCEHALEYLRKMLMITTAKTTRGLIITVCNYETYQNPKNYEDNSEGNKKTTRRQQQGDTINKNDKNDKNEIDISAVAHKLKTFKQWDEKEFYEDIAKNKSSYTKEMLRDFYNKWTEKSATGKMKFQLEKTWETQKRLVTWFNNQDKFGTKKTTTKEQLSEFDLALQRQKSK
jgi:hypothetical protein